MLVSKTHLIIRKSIRRPEYSQSLHLHIFMHQKSTNLLKLRHFLLGDHSFLLLDAPDVTDLVINILRVQTEIMVSRYDYLMLIG